MTTQPELPEVAALPARPALRLAPVPGTPDVDFDGFVRTYEARLRRLVLRRIGDLCEAEEITQETLLRAYQHRESFSSEDELMAWSTVVAQRLVIDRVRVRGRSIAVADVPETARLGRDTADIVVARHEARAALESLEAIPTRQAAILWAREVEGLHYEEIAERFDISEPAVRSLLHRGRKALRKEFKDRTGSLPLGGLAPFAPWLLALKAAGKVRGAARAAVRSSGGAAVALSLTALLGSGLFAGHGHAGKDGGVRIHPDAGGATQITLLADPAGVSTRGAAHPAYRGGSAAGVARPAVTGSHPTATGKDVCTNAKDAKGPKRPLCFHAGHDPIMDTTFHVALPDNPVLPDGIVVTTDYVQCSQTPVPQDGPVTCTQSPSSKPADSPDQPPLGQPSEGVSR